MLHALIEDNPNNLDTQGEMAKFLASLTHGAALTTICRQERRSGDPMLERKYTQGKILTTLTAFLQALGKPDSTPIPPKPALVPPGRSLSAKPSAFSLQRPASVNALHIDLVDGSSLNIPPVINGDDQHIVQCYAAAINAIQADSRKFSLSSKCVICGGICPFVVLNDADFLKKHHIAY